jgi:hypothetical protein
MNGTRIRWYTVRDLWPYSGLHPEQCCYGTT